MKFYIIMGYERSSCSQNPNIALHSEPVESSVHFPDRIFLIRILILSSCLHSGVANFLFIHSSGILLIMFVLLSVDVYYDWFCYKTYYSIFFLPFLGDWWGFPIGSCFSVTLTRFLDFRNSCHWLSEIPLRIMVTFLFHLIDCYFVALWHAIWCLTFHENLNPANYRIQTGPTEWMDEKQKTLMDICNFLPPAWSLGFFGNWYSVYKNIEV